ncbi:hypothetical protein BOW53_05215 [Solemya pervernicosa gill symbiont]|uniref:Sulfur reduction protein DsrS n=2 Tax=Gammaproteobacteria incertae sedis TaxID=118884 RepID=A0A1T2L872_9GAMM|nr:hypothetical protein BOW53_05215 [Solemya pervernicosa gill symbiont]
MLVTAEAIRIDEHAMVVHGLTGEDEARVKLNPTGRDEQYLSAVRELLSTHALDSPQGYPVFLRRWARMGQISNSPLDKLLLIGEPEAVIAVACAPDLTDDLARLAWWASPTAEVAGRMLENEAVRDGVMGPVLAEYLAEFLPFESEPEQMLRSVRLILRPGLIDEKMRAKLWDTGRTRKAYRVGFLEKMPNELPQQLTPRSDYPRYLEQLQQLQQQGNRTAGVMLRALDQRGQSFLDACQDVLRRPGDQDVVAALFDAIGSYFAELRSDVEQFRDMSLLLEYAAQVLESEDERVSLISAIPELREELLAAVALAHIDEGVLIPLFSHSDAVGTLLRKKLIPITDPLVELFQTLRTPRD